VADLTAHPRVREGSDGRMAAPPAQATRRWIAPLVLVLALCIVRLWLMPLGGSLWADETATYFVVHFGGGHPSLAVAPQVVQSIYYWLPWMAEKVGGFSEVVYRLPSVLAMGGALFLIARLARRLIHPGAAWFAVFLCLSMRAFNFETNDARPYPLGTLVATAGVLFLVRWLDCGRWPDAASFVVFAALLWRVQLVYWPFYLVFALYACVRLVGRETPVGWPGAAAVFAVLGVALLPVALQALALVATGREHVIAPLPPPRVLFYSLEPGLFAVCAGGVWLVARLLRWPRVSWPVSLSSLALTITWWLCPPLALFAFSWLTGQSLFVARYYSLLLPGAALTGTAIVARFIPVWRWPAMSAILGAGVLLWVGDWSRPVPGYHNGDWRGAAQTVNARVLDAETPVICASPFIEGRWPVWHPEYPLPAFLYAPLAAYPIRGHVYTFPYESSPPARRYAATLLHTLGSSRRFFLYGNDTSVRPWQQWFERSLPRAWTDRRLGPFGIVGLVEFDRAGHQM
jgi:Dolichyl-phosphate-mannose-protein mannosyltransferase